MTNPITGVGAPGETTAITQSAGTKTNADRADKSPSAGSAALDSANVSQTQSLLQTISDTVAGVPTVNQDAVTAVRQAIANGTYQVNPERVAKQLLSSDTVLAGQTVGE